MRLEPHQTTPNHVNKRSDSRSKRYQTTYLDTKTKVTQLVEEKLAEPDFENCFLLDVELPSPTRINVFLDSDTGVTFTECRRVSRHVEAVLDEEGFAGGKYTIEVSSPGATRPLRVPRQYPKHVGRKLEVKRHDADTVEGTLLRVSDGGVVIEEKIVRKEGKKKIREKLETEIPFEQIREARVKLAF